MSREKVERVQKRLENKNKKKIFFGSIFLACLTCGYLVSRSKSTDLQSKNPVKITHLHKVFSLELREAGKGRNALRITALGSQTLE